ncbi:unnamed protein product [Protopolystoma xenopodis]|uniref:Uncharacterized protein n=1 Tax=Protopolystoma xenopodis TaxID=117903 RepID=A0A3S5CN23_9PLAT|nr:unnamed protein product [Protopolystoma xenopodis]
MGALKRRLFSTLGVPVGGCLSGSEPAFSVAISLSRSLDDRESRVSRFLRPNDYRKVLIFVAQATVSIRQVGEGLSPLPPSRCLLLAGSKSVCTCRSLSSSRLPAASPFPTLCSGSPAPWMIEPVHPVGPDLSVIRPPSTVPPRMQVHVHVHVHVNVQINVHGDLKRE